VFTSLLNIYLNEYKFRKTPNSNNPWKFHAKKKLILRTKVKIVTYSTWLCDASDIVLAAAVDATQQTVKEDTP
jgi:hypothetical protein